MPPAPLLRLLRFRRGAGAARLAATVVEVLDGDDAFRARVAAEAERAGADALGRASVLYLQRPDGWRAELDELVRDAEAAARAEQAAAEERSAARRSEHLAGALDRARAERDAAAEARRSAEEAAAAERSARAVATARIDALEQELAAAHAERDAAVADLVAARTLAEERLARLRELESSAPPAPAPVRDPEPEPVPSAGPDRAELAELVALVDGLRGRLVALGAPEPAPPPAAPGARTGPPTRQAPGRGPDQPAGPAADAAPRRPRRRPPRLRRGALEGTPEGTRQYLSAPGVVVVVDGYNVSMTGWPTLDRPAQRDSLVTLAGTVAARTGAEIRLVFDGVDDGGAPAVATPLPVRVTFSPDGREADDVVLELVDALPAERPVVVVSADRRVADGARARGAAVVAPVDLLALGRS